MDLTNMARNEYRAQARYAAFEQATGRRTPPIPVLSSKAVVLTAPEVEEKDRKRLEKAEAEWNTSILKLDAAISATVSGEGTKQAKDEAASAAMRAGIKLADTANKIAAKVEGMRDAMATAARRRALATKAGALAPLQQASALLADAALDDALAAALRDNRKNSAYRPPKNNLRPFGGGTLPQLIEELSAVVNPPPPPFYVTPVTGNRIANGDTSSLTDIDGESIDAAELMQRGYCVAHGPLRSRGGLIGFGAE
jgi:hypothetical protein